MVRTRSGNKYETEKSSRSSRASRSRHLIQRKSKIQSRNIVPSSPISVTENVKLKIEKNKKPEFIYRTIHINDMTDFSKIHQNYNYKFYIIRSNTKKPYFKFGVCKNVTDTFLCTLKNYTDVVSQIDAKIYLVMSNCSKFVDKIMNAIQAFRHTSKYKTLSTTRKDKDGEMLKLVSYSKFDEFISLRDRVIKNS